MRTFFSISKTMASVAAVATFALVGTACGGSDDSSNSTQVDTSKLPGGGKYCDRGDVNICDELSKDVVSIEGTVADSVEITSDLDGGAGYGMSKAGEVLKLVCLNADTEQVGIVVPKYLHGTVKPEQFTTRGGQPVGFLHMRNFEGGNSAKGSDTSLWKKFDDIEKTLGTHSCDDSRTIIGDNTDQLRRPVG